MLHVRESLKDLGKLESHPKNFAVGATQLDFCIAACEPQFNHKIVAILSLDHNR